MNQDQRELLELAAYAIGYKIGCRGCGTWGCVGECEWNPLTNKADAFDLMVKLHIGTDPYPIYAKEKFGVTATKYLSIDESIDSIARYEEACGSPKAATMLAITRAAAAIGKQMKEQMK